MTTGRFDTGTVFRVEVDGGTVVFTEVIDVAFTVSADTDSLRQSGVSVDTVLAPSVGSPMVSEAQ